MEEKQEKLHNKLKLDLNELTNQSLTKEDIREAYFNLSGFIRTINKMIKENDCV